LLFTLEGDLFWEQLKKEIVRAIDKIYGDFMAESFTKDAFAFRGAEIIYT
jgi:hypothetical protein